MTDMEILLIEFINECHRKVIYRKEKYQLLHDKKYQREFDLEYTQKIRSKYVSKCLEAAYELKTYYAENGILSNTIVLKMRPDSPEIREFTTIKVYSDSLDDIREYTHHAIEIFKEHGKYKVRDVLHSDKVVWLETYLDELCKVNNCQRAQLRYDLGYLAPCHAFANNMQELSDLLRYLDKTYCIGKPRGTLMNLGAISQPGILTESSGGIFLSDDVAMDFDEFGRLFGIYDEKRISETYLKVYDRLMKLRFNMLHLLCLGRIMRDPIIKISIAEGIFDDAKICELMENATGIPGHVG